MKKRYKFTDKNQSKNGILSVCLGAAALFLTGGIFAAAYLKSGQAGKTVAVLGVPGAAFVGWGTVLWQSRTEGRRCIPIVSVSGSCD